jgi:hypothetical protein
MNGITGDALLGLGQQNLAILDRKELGFGA